MNKLWEKRLCYLAWLTAGIIIMFWGLEDIVGLHRDEAMFGLFAELILDGARPLCGVFNNYTSPIHSYMLAFFIKIFGNSIWTLRFLGPVFSLITIAIIFDMMRQFSLICAQWTACFLVTFPPVVMLSRLCGEVFVLNPFLFFGAIWIYFRLCQSRERYKRNTGFILAGILMSLGIWNHVIFLPSMAALIICYTIFMWPGIRCLFNNVLFFTMGSFIGFIPKFVSTLIFGNSLFPSKPSIPTATLTSSLLNFLYTLSGDGLYARFSGKSNIPFTWGMVGIFIMFFSAFCFSRPNNKERKIFCGICVFLVLNFIGIWAITPFGSIGSRLWLIPVWTLPVLLGICMVNLHSRKRFIPGCILISINVISLLVNYYIPNSYSPGAIKPSVYVGGKYDNTWDYYDHRKITEKLARTDEEYIFISNINVFTFYYLTPKEQRHRIKLLWPIILGGGGNTPEKRIIYDRVTYKGPMPKSTLFVFYDSDKDYLEHFSKEKIFPMTTPDNTFTHPGFIIYRLK